MKKILAVLMMMVLVIGLFAGCASNSGNETASSSEGENGDKKKTVGVAMPTKDLQRWNQDGENMKAQLEAAGYNVDLQYANNDVATQVSQIENMVSNGVDILVIASIDGSSLGTPLASAKENKIPVIAYDRLIMNSDAVSYYATFDNFMVGVKQGQYIEETLDLKNAAGPFNLEMVAGAPDDNNAKYFFGGAMSILQPYIESGKLVVPSGQKEFEKVATANWNTEAAQSRFDAILASNYASGQQLDVVLASNDSTALGVANALATAYKGKYPILTGQDCDIANVKNMIQGKQSMSIFKDTRVLAKQTVKMVDGVLAGSEAEVNDTETYNNGTGVIPTYLCEPVYADINNYKELLIDSGYYKEDQLQ